MKPYLSHKGYTLFEVLMAITVLSIGVSFIFPAFFRSADMLRDVSSRFEAQEALNHLLVDAEEILITHKPLKEIPRSGHQVVNGVQFPYDLNITPVFVYKKTKMIRGTQIYRIEGTVRWNADRPRSISGAIYAVQ